MKVTYVEPMDDYKLLVVFENNEKKIFNVKPYIKGEWFGELNDVNYFKQVKIDPLLHDTVVWPNEQDIAPHELYELGHPI